MNSATPKAKWYVDLIKRYEDLAKRNRISEEAKHEMWDLLLAIAREQYMSGNRSGIRWARKQNIARAAYV